MNMKTKIPIAILLLLLTTGHGTAQGMPVYDNTNFISLAKSLVESAKQTAELLKTVEFLKEQKDNIVQVSEVVRQLRALQRMSDNNQRLYDLVRTDLRDILGSPYIRAEEIERISSSFDELVARSAEDLDFIDQILTSDRLKMSDAERTLIIKEKEAASREMVAEIAIKTKRYRDIISFRRMQAAVNGRTPDH
jgi:hypothetical protein